MRERKLGEGDRSLGLESTQSSLWERGGSSNPTAFVGEVTMGSMDRSGSETEESKVCKGNGTVYVWP